MDEQHAEHYTYTSLGCIKEAQSLENLWKDLTNLCIVNILPSSCFQNIASQDFKSTHFVLKRHALNF